jgi:hypothetical protein
MTTGVLMDDDINGKRRMIRLHLLSYGQLGVVGAGYMGIPMQQLTDYELDEHIGNVGWELEGIDRTDWINTSAAEQEGFRLSMANLERLLAPDADPEASVPTAHELGLDPRILLN